LPDQQDRLIVELRAIAAPRSPEVNINRIQTALCRVSPIRLKPLESKFFSPAFAASSNPSVYIAKVVSLRVNF